MLDQSAALAVLNILGPFKGRKLNVKQLRNSFNAVFHEPYSSSEFADLLRECDARGWIEQDVDAFANDVAGITEDGQQLRDEFKQ